MITIDSDAAIPVYSRICTLCIHWNIRDRSCAAFPEPNSIPLPIWLGEHDHRTAYEGDNGIQFDPAIPDPNGGNP